jgi:hypothetical protein
MIGAMKVRVALGLVLTTCIGPAAVSDALPSTVSTSSVTRVEQADNAASFTYRENGQNGSASSFGFKPDDPFTFFVYAFPPAPGTNLALLRIELVNNTGGEMLFPGGLQVRVILSSSQRTQVALTRHSATRLAPGARLQAEATAALRGFGHYSVSAFTVARFTAPG